MLQDELRVIKNLVNDLTVTEPERRTFTVVDSSRIVQTIRTSCERVKEAWLNAFFSESPDHSLQRYFYFHLEGISNLSDTLFQSNQQNYYMDADQMIAKEINDQLMSLIVHLKEIHERFFNMQQYAPIVWWRKELEENAFVTGLLIERLSMAGLPVEQSSAIISYLQGMKEADQGGCYSFHALNYFGRLVKKLGELPEKEAYDENQLNQFLTDFNFNHLQYVDYRCDHIRNQLSVLDTSQEKIRLLLDERNKLKLITLYENTLCHTQFPSIIAMLDKWLCEQVIYVEEQNRLDVENGLRSDHPKLLINLSVAQIGCLLRVLYEAECFGNTPLTEVLKFVTQNVSSKKQVAITIGGLSKEYYSTTQVSAGKVIVLFQRLIAILKRIFFPLLVVASVIFGV